MANELTIEGKTYYGNKFFKPVQRRRRFSGYEFIGDITELLDSGSEALESLDEKGELVFRNKKISLTDISNLKFKNRNIKIYRSKFTDDTLTVNGLNVHFYRCTFNLDLNCITCKHSSIEILRSENINKIFTNECSKFSIYSDYVKLTELNVLDVEDSKFDIRNSGELFVLIEESSLKSITFTNVVMKDFDYFISSFDSLIFNNVTYDTELLFNLNQKGGYSTLILSSVRFNNCNFKLVKFFSDDFIPILKPLKISLIDTSNVYFTNLNITSLSLNGDLLNNIKFSSCYLKRVGFMNFSVGSNIAFKNCKANKSDSLISIDSSILKAVEINPSFLHNFDKISFKDSTITGVELHNYKPILEKVILNSKFEIDSKIDLCRELTALMNEQNNKHYATIYRALELELRAKSNDSSISWFDKQVLNLNFWSNVHGTMPQKALFWMLLMIVIMFGIINVDLSFQTGLEYEAGFDFLSQNYSYFIKPFTFLSDVEQSYKPFNSENMQAKFHPVTKGFDFLFKIFYAYLLYQFIAAFRKFNK